MAFSSPLNCNKMNIYKSIILGLLAGLIFAILERNNQNYYNDGFNDGKLYQQEIELVKAKKRVEQNRLDSIRRNESVLNNRSLIFDKRGDYDY